MQIIDFNINQEKIFKLLSSNKGIGLGEMYQKLIERKFSIGEVGIPRNILQHWQSEKLLPFENKQGGWTRFSLVEFVWLRCMSEMRSLGLSHNKMRRIKERCFDFPTEEYKNYFISSFEKFPESEMPHKNEVLAFYKRKDIPDSLWQDTFNEMQASDFTMLIMQIIIYDQNACFTVDKEDKFRVVILSDSLEEIKKANDESISFLMKSSFSLINVKKIVNEFFNNENLKYDSDYVIGFLKPKEKKIIEGIRKGSIKNMTIHFGKNDDPVRLEFTSSKPNESDLNQAARLVRKGEFSKITVQSESGKIVNYEKKEIIKL